MNNPKLINSTLNWNDVKQNTMMSELSDEFGKQTPEEMKKLQPERYITDWKDKLTDYSKMMQLEREKTGRRGCMWSDNGRRQRVNETGRRR